MHNSRKDMTLGSVVIQSVNMRCPWMPIVTKETLRRMKHIASTYNGTRDM